MRTECKTCVWYYDEHCRKTAMAIRLPENMAACGVYAARVGAPRGLVDRSDCLKADTMTQALAILADVGMLLGKKNKDYGDSFRREGRLAKAYSPVAKLLIRIDDKLERLEALGATSTKQSVSDETTKDTIKDLIGYFTLLLVLLEEK